MLKQKLYCYIDETGQDKGSEFFVVVVLISDKDQEKFRKKVIELENLSKTGYRKWHKTRIGRNKKFLELILESKLGEKETFFARYKKPIPYFLPILETLEKSILLKAKIDYQAIIYVDGIDKKKSAELTNALRIRHIKTNFIRGTRDESEPLIRLVDRWAGCIRAAFLGKKIAKEIYNKAVKEIYLKEIKNPDTNRS